MQPTTILVVEDDTGPRAALVALLTANQYQVASAAEGREALNLVAAGIRPSLILLDMLMPSLDGLSFLSLLRMSRPELSAVPIVIMTGLSEITEEWARSIGVVALLRKPLDEAKLIDVVRRHAVAS